MLQSFFGLLLFGCFHIITCDSQVCGPGSSPLVYSFPVPTANSPCTLAQIPPTFGTLASNFSLEVVAELKTLNPGTNNLAAIMDDGVFNVVGPNFAMYVGGGKLIAVLAGTPWCQTTGCAFTSQPYNWLQTSNISLNVKTTIVVMRKQGMCRLTVDGTEVVSTPCSNAPLVPAPSNSNDWSIVGIGAQKRSMSACGSTAPFTSTTGTIQSITLSGGAFFFANSICNCPGQMYAGSMLKLCLTTVSLATTCLTTVSLHRSRHMRPLPSRHLRKLR